MLNAESLVYVCVYLCFCLRAMASLLVIETFFFFQFIFCRSTADIAMMIDTPEPSRKDRRVVDTFFGTCSVVGSYGIVSFFNF